MAASATFALKAGVWFRRARLLIVSPDSRANLARRQAETPLIALFRFPEPALLGRRAERRKIEVGLIRGALVKTRMRTSAIVKVQIPADRMSRLADGFVSSQIDLLVFDATPQPPNEHVVPPSPFPFPAYAESISRH